jgi:hypothetical protein
MTDKEVQELFKQKAKEKGVDGGVYTKESIFDADTQVLGFNNPERFIERVKTDESYTRFLALFDHKQAKRFMDLIKEAYISGADIDDIEHMIKQATK